MVYTRSLLLSVTLFCVTIVGVSGKPSLHWEYNYRNGNYERVYRTDEGEVANEEQVESTTEDVTLSTASDENYEHEPNSVAVDYDYNVKKGKKFAAAVFFKANWFRAFQYCKYHGMNLASVENREQESDLESVLGRLGFDPGLIWTSGTDHEGEGKFFWMSTGKPLTYTKWGSSQPNGGKSGNCLAINRGSVGYFWDDILCSDERHFVCEYYAEDMYLFNREIPAYV